MNDDLTRLVDVMRARSTPAEPERAPICSACNDTGVVDVDDGLDAAGHRLRSPSSQPCNSMIHQRVVKVDDPTTERFS